MNVRSAFAHLITPVITALLATSVITGPAHANQGDGGDAPFTLENHYSLAKAGWSRSNAVRVFTGADARGTLTVTDTRGNVIVSKNARPEQTWLDFPKPKKLFTRYNITATAADGRSVTWPFAVLNLPSDSTHHAAFEPCATITWAYDDTKAPKNTRKFQADLRKALRVVEKNTGVTFTRTKDLNSADMVFTWGKARGAAAIAYSTGEVQFSRSARGNRDSNAGMGSNARGWVMVHEVLHILGLAHTKERDSVMYPMFASGLSSSDKALLKALYGMHPCPT